MYGLPGLRLGYAVTSDPSLVGSMGEYVEMATIGASTASQTYILGIEEFFFAHPDVKLHFMDMCRRDLNKNRLKLKELNNKILDSGSVPNIGMFAFLKKGELFTKAINNAKIKVFDGEHFGKKGYVRISLNVDPMVFTRAIDKLNKAIQ